jgi:hypothetical protein
MALIDEFLPDFDDTFKNPEEFGETREFMFVNKIFIADVVWDKDHLKQRFIVQQQGVFIGDVMLYIPVYYFRQLGGIPDEEGEDRDPAELGELIEPKPEEILYSPRDVAWIIGEVTEAGQVYEIALTKLLT